MAVIEIGMEKNDRNHQHGSDKKMQNSSEIMCMKKKELVITDRHKTQLNTVRCH